MNLEEGGKAHYQQLLREDADAATEDIFSEAENAIRNVDPDFPTGTLTWMLIVTFDSVPEYDFTSLVSIRIRPSLS